MHAHVYSFIYIYIYIYIERERELCICICSIVVLMKRFIRQNIYSGIVGVYTVSSHKFNSQHFNARVSNPISKHIELCFKP